jgi:hypothetical protein
MRFIDGHIFDPITTADYANPFPASTAASSRAASHRNSKSRRRTSGPAFVRIAEDPEDEVVSVQLAEDIALRKEPIPQVSQPELEAITVDKENAVPGEGFGKANSVTVGKQKRKPKKRRSIGQQSGRRKKRPSNESVQSIAEELPQDEAAPELVDEELEWETMIGNGSSLLPEDVLKPMAHKSPVSKKRRRRKSVVLKPRKRKRSGEFTTQSVVSPAEIPDEREAIIIAMTEEVISSEPTPGIQFNRETRQRFSDASNNQTPGNGTTYEPEIDGDETYIDEVVSPEKPTPKVPSKKAKAKARNGRRSGSEVQSSSSGKAGPSCVKQSSKATFPILTHRMTNTSALPTITEEVEANLDSDPDSNSLKTKFADRSAPNAIDVLAQICRETISTTISKISNTSNTARTRELKRKRNVLEAFSLELDSQLFDMSIAIEHRLMMEARVKKAKKVKTDAQNEWMEIRRQREEIALKCDNIRTRNQLMEAEGKETYELSEKLHELEMIVEKPELDGEGGVSDGLEHTLRSVAMTVSGVAGAGDGLLARVKDYNRQLERTALVLEGREVDKLLF